jgi:hypothetical protein
MGRAPKIINIPSKPTPEGFKIWVLTNEGYILNWLWHARGNGGLVDLDESFTKDEGFLKTQAVVLNLITQRDPNTNKPLYPPGKHIIWLDNLFISVKLLTRLRELRVGAVGTVRITRTERERRGGLKGDILVNKSTGSRKKVKVKVPAKQIDKRLADPKLTHAA